MADRTEKSEKIDKATHGDAFHKELTEELQRLGIEDAEQILQEFDLCSIDEGVETVHGIAKKVRDRIDMYSKLLEETLQPDSSLAAMNECSFFSDDEMTKVVKSYRQLMALLRHGTVADLEGTKQANETFIKEALLEWRHQRTFLVLFAKRLHEGWKQEQPLHREKGYFG